ncbi:hypothetical protein BD310DRAFT_912775 [Dichomitus squalens]|uniref:Uncharacterized protein n=1 Tax=Dichomitus squalens TaxID=114155 RepID=A0A4Q9QE45_9APHY|nr:hypothetical protein BD310DRAFT_912775 [Dichomitus squalens]
MLTFLGEEHSEGQFGNKLAHTTPYTHVLSNLPPGQYEEASMASSSNSVHPSEHGAQMPRDVAAAARGVHAVSKLVVPLRSTLAAGTEVMSKSCAHSQPALRPSGGVEDWLGTAAGLTGVVCGGVCDGEADVS